MKATIVGAGVIGGGWAARFLLNGWDVSVVDPAPDAAAHVDAILKNARRSLPSLYDRAMPLEGQLSVTTDLAAAVSDADWIQESVPERLDIKHAILAQIAESAPAKAIIGSSTSGFRPSELNQASTRAIVAHPFNPVYLLPLVELSGDAEICSKAAEILRGIGMFPLTLRHEIDAHIADRLLEAVWRESLWLVKDGIATTAEIDDAIRMGFGLRWAQMGLFETYRIAGGPAGMRHFLAQFGPALQWPWTKLVDVPDLDDDLINTIAAQSDAQSGHLSVGELERLRDDNLVGILRSLKRAGQGAGEVISAHEASLPLPAASRLPTTLDIQVPPGWADYNGHMNEARYMEAATKATDRYMELAGADAAYVASGKSYFTVESHIRHLAEVHVGDRLRAETTLIDGAGKRMHLMHRLSCGEGEDVATVETLLLHVDLTTRKTCAPDPLVAEKLAKLAASQGPITVRPSLGKARPE